MQFNHRIKIHILLLILIFVAIPQVSTVFASNTGERVSGNSTLSPIPEDIPVITNSTEVPQLNNRIITLGDLDNGIGGNANPIPVEMPVITNSTEVPRVSNVIITLGDLDNGIGGNANPIPVEIPGTGQQGNESREGDEHNIRDVTNSTEVPRVSNVIITLGDLDNGIGGNANPIPVEMPVIANSTEVPRVSNVIITLGDLDLFGGNANPIPVEIPKFK